MYSILFSFGKINIYTHGLLIALGAIFGGAIIFYLAKRENLQRRYLFDLLVYSLFGGIIGARILYVILYYYQFDNWHEMFLVWHGGLTSFGGLLFGLLTAALILRKRHQKVFEWFDIGIIGLLLGWTFGRVGCLLSGDVPGVISNSKIAIWGQIPVSLFEGIWSLVVAGFLFYLSLSQKEFVQKRPNGFVFFIGLALYFLGRFIVDFWRNEPIFFLIRGGQIASLVLFIITVAILYFYYFKGENHAKENI